MTGLRLTSDKAAAVNPLNTWTKITPTNKPPIGARMLLIRRDAGIAQVVQFKDDGWYTHYFGLPVFGDDE